MESRSEDTDSNPAFESPVFLAQLDRSSSSWLGPRPRLPTRNVTPRDQSGTVSYTANLELYFKKDRLTEANFNILFQ
jgi:hypothetical protein